LCFRSSSDESGTDPPRKITVQRMSQEVGLRLCGGNITGVFIAEISSDSEQVATELNRPSDTISVVAQHNLNSKCFNVQCYTSPAYDIIILFI